MKGNDKRKNVEVIGFLGVGLDNKDGHQRLTQTENFVIVGGSDETHEHMQEKALKFNEVLERRGKRLPETSLEEVIEIYYEVDR